MADERPKIWHVTFFAYAAPRVLLQGRSVPLIAITGEPLSPDENQVMESTSLWNTRLIFPVRAGGEQGAGTNMRVKIYVHDNAIASIVEARE